MKRLSPGHLAIGHPQIQPSSALGKHSGCASIEAAGTRAEGVAEYKTVLYYGFTGPAEVVELVDTLS